MTPARDRREGDAARHPLPAVLIHDLRTPLSQIIGYSELLAEQAQEGGQGALVPDLQKVSAAGYRLLELMNDHLRPVSAESGEADDDGDDANDPDDADGADGGESAEAAADDAPEGLAGFIVANREPILADWEAFARTCTPAATPMDIEALRDHANEMLTVIAADLRTPQDVREQAEKSMGNAPADADEAPTAAEEHGAGRAESGFSVEQMISEYRALRASVIRLWTKSKGSLAGNDLADLTRFNEAIDQSLAESVTRYTLELDQSKEMFLAILGHDLRTPLGAVLTSATFMLETQNLPEPSLTLTTRIASSSNRMVHMVGALLDFTRSRLGGGIPIAREKMNMEKVVHDAVDELQAAHPGRTIEIDARGEQQGEWDGARVAQALANLIGNALEHGSQGTPVHVETRGEGDEITIAVHNRGRTIPHEQLSGIFSPMKPREVPENGAGSGQHGNLGLGLYIADRIVNAHGGRIEVESTDDGGTTFIVHLPRRG